MERLAKSRELTVEETKEIRLIEKELEHIWALEEIKARQRSRHRNLLEGDMNSAYFQTVDNQRTRKKKVDCLEGPSGLVYDQKGMMKIAVDFYKNLCAKESEPNVKLGPSFWDDHDKVVEEENRILVAPFSESEIKNAIFSCYPEGAPGPDGLPFLFYQKF